MFVTQSFTIVDVCGTMNRSLRVVGVLLLLAVTGVLVVLQINLRNELSDAHEKLKALESKNGALQRDVRGANTMTK